MITQILFMSTLSMMIMMTSITCWMRLKNKISVLSRVHKNLLQLGNITQGLNLISEKRFTKICFRKPKKISSEQNKISNPRLILPKFQKNLPNTQNRKSEKLNQPRNNEKKEVNNFGFPSSFGEAGVDFPMFDLHR